jgi:hypothetical protein
MIFTVELALEIDAPTAAGAAALAILEARSTTEPLTVSVFSETGEKASEDDAVRHWRQITIDPSEIVDAPRSADVMSL